jgi:hypothetical protein
MTVLDLLIKINCFEDIHEAASIITAGGVHVNYKKIRDPKVSLANENFILQNNFTLIKIGIPEIYFFQNHFNTITQTKFV